MSSTTCYNNCAVNDLIYWKDQKQSGIVFGVGVLTLYLLKTYTLLGLLSHTLLYATTLCTAWVLIKNIINAIQQGSNQQVQAIHPFQKFLDTIPTQLEIKPEQAEKFAKVACNFINNSLNCVVEIVLAKSLSTSTSFAAVLYFFGGIFANYEFLTLAMLVYISAFTFPKVYQLKQKEIDEVISKAWTPIEPHYTKISSMIMKFKNANQKLTRSEDDKDDKDE